MSRSKGNRAPSWVAAFLRPWFPSAEATPNSRHGRDVLGTPGLAVEVKTGAEWRHRAMTQAAGYARDHEVALVVYLPPGCGERNVGDALAIMPLREIMPVLVAAGYAPPKFNRPEGSAHD